MRQEGSITQTQRVWFYKLKGSPWSCSMRAVLSLMSSSLHSQFPQSYLIAHLSTKLLFSELVNTIGPNDQWFPFSHKVKRQKGERNKLIVTGTTSKPIAMPEFQYRITASSSKLCYTVMSKWHEVHLNEKHYHLVTIANHKRETQRWLKAKIWMMGSYSDLFVVNPKPRTN